MKIVPIDHKVRDREERLAMGMAAFHMLRVLIPYLEDKKILARTDVREMGDILIAVYEHLMADTESASDKRLFGKIASKIGDLAGPTKPPTI